jgi:uncharacterized protein
MSSRKPLVVDVLELARERGTLEGDLPLAAMPRLTASLRRSEGELHYVIRGEVDSRGRPGAEMRLRAQLLLECQRCSSEFLFPLDRTAQFRFVASEEELNALPIEDDEVDVIVGGHQTDVVAWMEDEALLSLPLVPRHDECIPAASFTTAVVDPAGPDLRPKAFGALAGFKPVRKPS